MIRTYVVVQVVREWITLPSGVCVAPGFLLLLENTYVVKNQVKMKSDIVFFARKRYTVTVNGISVSPSWVCCALNN